MTNKLAPEGHLLSPYYSVEEAVRHGYAPLLRCDDPCAGDSFERVSYVCEGLMASLVRANLKDVCRELWPDFTRISHERVVPDHPWQYGLYRIGDEGSNETFIYKPRMEWTELQAIAAEGSGSDVPAALKGDPILLLLFVNLFPFRASFSAVKFLLGIFDKSM